eukprot:8767065-Heterocapsa_arctica.AAC.1
MPAPNQNLLLRVAGSRLDVKDWAPHEDVEVMGGADLLESGLVAVTRVAGWARNAHQVVHQLRGHGANVERRAELVQIQPNDDLRDGAAHVLEQRVHLHEALKEGLVHNAPGCD